MWPFFGSPEARVAHVRVLLGAGERELLERGGGHSGKLACTVGFSRAIWTLRLCLLAGLATVLVTAGVLKLIDLRWAVVGIVLAILGQQIAERMLFHRAERRLSERLALDDLDGATSILKDLREYAAGSPAMVGTIELNVAHVASLRGDHVSAAREFERLLDAPHMIRWRTLIENNLAWEFLQLGMFDRGLPLAWKAIADAETADRSLAGACRGTYAIGLILAGRADEGAPMLERVLSDYAADGPMLQACRALYLGDGLRALGREDEAQRAYERAVREAPHSSWAARAKAKLS